MNIMNISNFAPRWSRRLRGYINLKTCLTLGAIALGGAFVVGLPAQEPEKTEVKDDFEPTISPTLVTDAIKKARIGNAEREVPKQILPVGIGVTGTITGPFAQKDSVQFETATLSFAEANQRLFQLDAVYDITVDLESQKRNVYGISLQSAASANPDAKSGLLGVSADMAMQNLSLTGAATGEFLSHNGVSWKVLTQPSNENFASYKGKVEPKDGTSIQGNIKGLFVNFANDKLETSTQDITDTSEFGPTAAPYEVDFRVTGEKALLHGAILSNPNKKEALLQVVTDTPVKTFRLSGIAEGKRFGDSGLAWAVATSDDVKQLKRRAFYSPKQPGAFTLALDSQAAPSSRSLLFTPQDRRGLSATPTNLITDFLKILKEFVLGQGKNKLSGNRAYDSREISSSEYRTGREGPIPDGPFNACDAEVDYVVTAQASGYTVNTQTLDESEGVNIVDGWKAKLTPVSEGISYFPRDPNDNNKLVPVIIKKGTKNVTLLWTRSYAVADKKIAVYYASNADERKPPKTVKIIKYTVTVKQLLDVRLLQRRGDTDCSVANPEATPGEPNDEDSDHDGTPDRFDPEPFNPNVGGTITPFVPVAAPMPAPMP